MGITFVDEDILKIHRMYFKSLLKSIILKYLIKCNHMVNGFVEYRWRTEYRLSQIREMGSKSDKNKL